MNHSEIIITPEEFGAKGDGVSNDFYAVYLAMRRASGTSDCTVLFGKDRTYYLSPEGISTDENPDSGEKYIPRDHFCALFLENCRNVTVKGDNTTILLENPLYYADIDRTENTVIEGFTFDYRHRPFALGTALEYDLDELSCVVQSDRDLHITGETTSEFAVLQRHNSRYHMFIRKIEPVDVERFIYRFYFCEHPNIRGILSITNENYIILPYPGFGHAVERAFSITSNRDFTMRDCTVKSMARFGFAVLGNRGTIVFDGVNVKKDENEPALIVGWRDCFHVKENRAKCIWHNCSAADCYDDIFNISASQLYVKEVISPTELDLYWEETGGRYSCIEKGNTVSVINMETGEDYGEAIVSEVVNQENGHNIIRFHTPFRDMKAGRAVKAHVLDCVAPGSEIVNCDFHGTFRFRGPIEIRDSHIFNTCSWIDLCAPVEGPIPKHIHVKNCVFECDDNINRYLHIEAQRENIPEKNAYHIEDITFEDCVIPSSSINVAEYDRPYVSFINCICP